MKKNREEDLLEIVNTSVDWARTMISCLETKGTPLTVEDCEWCLKQSGCAGSSLRKLIEGKARKAFRGSVRSEKANQVAVKAILPSPFDCRMTEGTNNYATWRRALYLASDEKIVERIRREIQTRFPWGC
jgi:hypothetical protein